MLDKGFFNGDEISWQTPGKRDTSKRFRSGERMQIQKQYLMMDVGEAKTIFDEENCGSKKSLSTFYKLKPKAVILISRIPHNACVCVIFTCIIRGEIL